MAGELQPPRPPPLPHCAKLTVVIDKPILKRLVVHDCGRRVVPDIKSARHSATVTTRGEAIAVSMWVPWRLLLAVVEVRTQVWLRAVALLGRPRPFFFFEMVLINKIKRINIRVSR